MNEPPGVGGPVYRGRPPGSKQPSGGRRRRRSSTSLSTTTERRMRRQLNRLTLVVAVVIVVALAVSRFAGNDTTTTTPAPGVTVAIEGALPVEVDRIIDGDTLDVRAGGETFRVRLYGVDTPERGEACFREATDRLRDLAGAQVQLLPDARLADRYDRQLRYVYASDGTLIDEALVREGYGLAWRDDGSKREAIIVAEEEARGAARGCLWSGG